ncbi:hypothetical protein Tsubulata_048906 [Turnera subulata]|uniref:BRCT domain-containing protein n=1 Tax=Turnera subulata TaxID=218843 RepID=A0A9Q0F8X7_9ROSI|nr:hypothetical protein Tsubulata_048906 [Turnera subulata]
MGSLGDDDGENKSIRDSPDHDFAYGLTQPFDSQSSPSSSPGEDCRDANELQFLQSTVPFDDTLPVENAFETQVFNFDGETQVLDEVDGFEGVDGLLVDEFDNHVVLDTDGEQTDGTEILGDNDELSDEELESRDNSESLSHEKIQHTPLCDYSEKQLAKQPNALTGERNSSGSVPRFTSIRAESLRASGLAAHSNSNSRSASTSKTCLEKEAVRNDALKRKLCEEYDNVCDIGTHDTELNGFKKEKICSSTVRKLFDDDSCVGKIGPSCNSDNAVGGKEVLQLINCDDRMAGLSYIDSQEPGDASQANALECVQKLIDENKELFDDEIDRAKCSKGTSNPVLMSKGPQNLAKRSTDRNIKGKTRIFEWDDGIEDEGGGDIFSRRKQDFFGRENLGRRSLGKPKNPEGKSVVQDDKVIRSDSKLDLRGLNHKKGKAAEVNFRKNLADEFDKQSNMDISAGLSKDAIKGNNNAEMLSVGLDTQIAAEAMEALLYGEDVPKHGIDDVHQALQVGSKESLKGCPRRKARNGNQIQQLACDHNSGIGVVTRQSKNKRIVCDRLSKQSAFSLSEHSKPVRNDGNTDPVMTRRKTANSSAARGRKSRKEVPSEVVELQRVRGITEGQEPDKIDDFNGTTSRRGHSGRKRQLDEPTTSQPVARRTRKSLGVSQLRSTENGTDSGEIHNMESDCNEPNRAGLVDVEDSTMLHGNKKSAESGSLKSLEPVNFMPNLTSCHRRPRSRRSSSVQSNEPHNSVKTSGHAGDVEKSMRGHRRLRNNSIIATTDSNMARKMQSRIAAAPDVSSSFPNSGRSSDQMPTAKAVKFCDRNRNADSSLSAKNKLGISSDKSPRQTAERCELAGTSPIKSMTPANDASPVCMGNGYFKQSCKKNLSRSSLMKELRSLSPLQPEPVYTLKDSRKRRDLADVRVLFSHHLDEDIIKQQRKIADRLKVSIASCITVATHFIADNFVRTRNMLEAIAFGKPVVTHLWLENVGQASYYIDEQNYILRDTKKEKEFGFSMPVTLAHARQHPLLQGRKVLITPHAKPGKEIISSLVRAVRGQAVVRVGRSALKEDIVSDDLLVLSCEEDYEICVPFLEKGAAVYSSELLLNGIVTQRLEYERHRLFTDHVKRTRSTLWLKKDGHNFTPVTKLK